MNDIGIKRVDGWTLDQIEEAIKNAQENKKLQDAENDETTRKRDQHILFVNGQELQKELIGVLGSQLYTGLGIIIHVSNNIEYPQATAKFSFRGVDVWIKKVTVDYFNKRHNAGSLGELLYEVAGRLPDDSRAYTLNSLKDNFLLILGGIKRGEQRIFPNPYDPEDGI